jgi:superfamily II DNA or RNA helicase
MESTNRLESTGLNNPFVVIISTGEIGRYIEPSENDASVIRFWDSPSDAFDRTVKNSEIKKFIPELNGLVWVPERFSSDVGESNFIAYTRGTWVLERESGQWGIKVRRSGEIPDENILVDPKALLIHRGGRSFNPVGALGSRLSMSSKYFVTRDRLLSKLYDQIRVSRGYRAILASTIRPFQHQINTMIRVLSDPIPRFILADEVGLGKTIEAGLIIKQCLLDDSRLKVLIIVPGFLVGQWRDELSDKLLLKKYIDNKTITIAAHDEIATFANYDFLIVDEAHQLTEDSMIETYEKLTKTLPVVSGLLLLTATPMRGNRIDYLRLLHLVDPISYPLSDEEQFESRLKLREDSARDIDYLKIDGLPASTLHECIDRIRSIFPLDEFCLGELVKIETILKSGNSAIEERKLLSAYLRTNYRISRRVIRNRRAEVAAEGFVVTGRELTNGTVCEIEEYLRTGIDFFISEVLDELRKSFYEKKTDSKRVLDLISSLLEAGLSSPEVLLDFLTQPVFVEKNSLLSDFLCARSADLCEEIKRSGPSARWKRVLEICDRHMSYPHTGGVVIFVGSTNIAKLLTSELSDLHGPHHVRCHLATMSLVEQDESIDFFLRHDGCRVLVMDRSGEEGRNLQGASEIVHFSIPISPNQLEQRLGRADRFSESMHHRATSTVFLESDSALIAGLFEFLAKGLNIFNRSVATAQHLLSIEFQNLLLNLLEKGLDAFFLDNDQLADRIDEEIETIAYIDQIESISTSQEFSDTDFEALLDLDESSDIEEAALGLYVFDRNRNPPTAPIGLSLASSKHTRQDLTQTMRLSLGNSDRHPAELRDLTSEKKHQLTFLVNRDIEYAFSRPVARSLIGTSLYRIGDPLVDWTIDWIENDELGRSWAVWRQVPKMPPTAVFSGAIRVGTRFESDLDLSDWGVNIFKRRMELSLPSRMIHLVSVGGKIFDHDEDRILDNIPRVDLTERNISGDNWKRVSQMLPNLDLSKDSDTTTQLMIEFAQRTIRDSVDYGPRRSEEIETHQYAVSVLKADTDRGHSPTRELSENRLNEENVIHDLVMSALEVPPCEVYSLGLIIMSKLPL